MTKCPVCGMMVDENTAPNLEYEGRTYYFMNEQHRDLFEDNPDKFLNRDPGEGKHT